jgi:hypothetical protein
MGLAFVEDEATYERGKYVASNIPNDPLSLGGILAALWTGNEKYKDIAQVTGLLSNMLGLKWWLWTSKWNGRVPDDDAAKEGVTLY